MLEALRLWRSGADGAAPPPRPHFTGLDDPRRSERFRFTGAEVFLFLTGDERFRLRLRDVSCTGVCGLTDAPVSPGELVMIQFEETLMPAAHVTWTRNAIAGFHMVNPLPLPRLRRLCERHKAGAAWSPAMRAGSDLHSWWTDAEEQGRGRRPRLDADGHKHPVPR
jgi:hypothetical protein